MEKTATEIVNEWSDQKLEGVITKLLSVARHGIQLSFPSLSSKQQQEDMSIVVDSLAEQFELSKQVRREKEELAKMPQGEFNPELHSDLPTYPEMAPAPEVSNEA